MEKRRIRLWSGGPHVTRETKLQMELWRAETGLSFGSLLDELIAHCQKEVGIKFTPTKTRAHLLEPTDAIIEEYRNPQEACIGPDIYKEMGWVDRNGRP